MKKSDLMPLFRLLSDEKVMEYIEPVFDLEKTRAFLDSAGLGEKPLIWAVEDDGVFLGYAIWHDYDETSREIGWVLYPEHWGKGIATKLTQELMQRAFSEDRDAVIECAPAQEVTKHIALKLGFKPAGQRDGCEVFRAERASITSSSQTGTYLPGTDRLAPERNRDRWDPDDGC